MVHSKRAKGLVPEWQSSPERRHYSTPEPSHMPWTAAFSSTPDCVFTSIVTKVPGPLEAGESSFWHGWRADCWGVGGHLPWGVSPFSQHPSCLTVIGSRECKTLWCCHDRLWLNLGWTFPYKTSITESIQNQEYLGKTIVHLFNQKKKVSRSNCHLQCTPHKGCWLQDRVI